MPFEETCPVEERIAMFRDWDTGAFAVSELSERYNVSRETFYVWKRRRETGDERWFEERSRAPGHCPHATPAAQVEQIVAMRHRFPRFGAMKVRGKEEEVEVYEVRGLCAHCASLRPSSSRGAARRSAAIRCSRS